MMSATLLALSFVSGLLIPIADGPPRFDIEATCRAADAGGGIGRTQAACRDDERQARTALEAKWQSYRPASRTECVDATQLVGSPSYVEVLTCLDMAANK